jgi:putative chitinase
MKLRELFDPATQKSEPSPGVFGKINNFLSQKPEANTPLKPATKSTPMSTPAKAPVAAAQPAPFVEPPSFKPADYRDVLIKTAQRLGFKSELDLARLLGQSRKETTQFTKSVEVLNYITPQQLYKFHTRLFKKGLTPDQVKTDPTVLSYLRNPVKLANDSYAGINGNGNAASGDGWKYRGRGFIQITGRTNYGLAGSLAHPENPEIYINNPDLLSTDPKESALAGVKFFLKRVGLGASQAKANRGISGHTNAGAGQRKKNTQQELEILRKEKKAKPKPTK